MVYIRHDQRTNKNSEYKINLQAKLRRKNLNERIVTYFTFYSFGLLSLGLIIGSTINKMFNGINITQGIVLSSLIIVVVTFTFLSLKIFKETQITINRQIRRGAKK